ncbi:MAG: pentatricopeptide repeat-containing protein [Chloroflexota bacterium]
MTTAVSLSPIASSPNWAARYEQQFAPKFAWAVQFVQTTPPADVRSHFPSLLILLERGWQRPFLHPLAADLIAALHPLPYRWGHWQEWLYISRQSVDLFAALERPLPQADLLAGMIDILCELGRYDEARQLFAEMGRIPLAGGVIRPLIRAGHRLSTRLLLGGRLAESVAEFERQTALLADIRASLPPEDALYAAIYLDLQETLIMRRQYRRQEAVETIEKILKQVAAWTAAPADLRREMHHHHGGISLGTGEFVLSAAAMDQAIQCAVEMDDPFAEASLYIDKTIPLWSLGKFDEVETAVRRGLYLCEKLNANWQVLTAISILVDVFIVRGEFAEALLWSAPLITLARQLGDEINECNAKTVRAIALLHQGAVGQARLPLEECLLLYREKQSLRWQSLVEANLSLYWALAGDAVRGRQFAQEALLRAQEIQAVNVIILARRSLARFQTGQEKKENLSDAAKLARDHHMLYAEASLLLLLAACYDDEAAQMDCWRQAVDLLHDMGLEGWLNGRSPQNPPHLPLIA